MAVEIGIVEERKNLKRNRIISTVRYGDEVSRHEIKKATGYSMTTVLGIIGELLEKGLLVEEECTSVRTGRRPTWLHVRPQGVYAVGVEFNADKLCCVAVNFAYEVVYTASTTVDPDDSASALVGKLISAIYDALNHLGRERGKVIGIGLGLPGLIDRTRGVALSYAYLHAWRDIPVRELIEKEFSCRVLIENNINAMAIAYRWQTYRQRAEDFVFFSIKHGIRMGMIINNRLFSGNGNAGEIGHVQLVNGTRYCSCGKRGCLDTEISSKAIRKKIAERMECGLFKEIRRQTGGDYSRITMQMFVDCVTRGDPDALDLLGETASYLGRSLAMVLGTLNPRRIIIASKSGMGGQIFSDMIYRVLEETTTATLLEHFSVECIQAPDSQGARGAAMMVMEDEFQAADEEL